MTKKFVLWQHLYEIKESCFQWLGNHLSPSDDLIARSNAYIFPRIDTSPLSVTTISQNDVFWNVIKYYDDVKRRNMKGKGEQRVKIVTNEKETRSQCTHLFEGERKKSFFLLRFSSRIFSHFSEESKIGENFLCHFIGLVTAWYHLYLRNQLNGWNGWDIGIFQQTQKSRWKSLLSLTKENVIVIFSQNVFNFLTIFSIWFLSPFSIGNFHQNFPFRTH